MSVTVTAVSVKRFDGDSLQFDSLTVDRLTG